MNRLAILNRLGHIGIMDRSSSPSWTPQNFLTTNSASDNVTALNDALTNHSNVKITTPGIYEIDDTIWLKSNQSIEFVAGCTIKKATGSNFCHVFANKGMQTRTYDTNITFIGNGLIIDTNEIDSYNLILYGSNGNFNFFKVHYPFVSGVTIVSSATICSQFNMQLNRVDNGIFRNIHVSGQKDAIHCGPMHDMLFEDIYTASGDDGFTFNAYDWDGSGTEHGNIERILVRRWTDDVFAEQGGAGMELIAGSWTNWTTTTDYQFNDSVINNGRIYQKTNTGTQNSSVAPVHTSGAATGADGINWRWKEDSTNDHCDLKDITLVDCTWASNRRLTGSHNGDGEFFRATFPGTFGNSIIDNIVIDNLTIASTFTTTEFIRFDQNIGIFEIKNTTGVISAIYGFVNILSSLGVAVSKIKLTNCNLTLPTGYGLIASDAVNFGTEIELNNSTFNNIYRLIYLGSLHDVSINITANDCSFINNVVQLINMASTTTSVVSFTATDCTFEETSTPAFYNNNATSNIIVVTTGSLGDSQPQLTSGTVDVTGSDLVLALGDNIVRNGKFRFNTTFWTAERGVITWVNDGTLRYTANPPTGSNDIVVGVTHVLSNNLRFTFRAKATGTTNTLTILNGTLVSIKNPALSENWQDYEFTLAIGVATTFYLKFGTSLANGVIIDVDDVQVVQY